MRATSWEYRLRVPVQILIFLLGFWAFWESWLGLTTKSTWLLLSAWFARQGWLGFQAATVVLLLVAVLFTGLGAWFRVWGAAYLGAGIVGSPQMHAQALLADGPYRRTRNPLYLGTLLHTIGISMLMPPAGGIFTIAAIWIVQVRLAMAEEPFLGHRFGVAYEEYRTRVPQFLMSPKPLVPASGAKAHWWQALAGESYFVGVALTLLGFGWDFNAQPLIRGILISFGISLVLQALLPRAPREPLVSAS